jgi:hypothetical protein
MDFLLKLIATASKFIEWATLKKVVMLSFVCLISLIGFTAVEERTQISPVFSQQAEPVALRRFVVTDDLATRLRAVVNSTAVSMVVVYAADLQLNERIAMHRFSDNPLLTALWDKYVLEFGASHPVFTKDDTSNVLMVAIVNGEFSCHRYSATINRLLVPSAPVTHVCYISLPPYYGSFAGFLEVSLIREPTAAEEQTLSLEMKRLSNDIFFKSIVPGLPNRQQFNRP